MSVKDKDDWSARAKVACEKAITHWAEYQRQAIATKEAYRTQGDERRAAKAFERECYFSTMRARAQEALHRLHRRDRRRDEWMAWEDHNRKEKAKKVAPR